MQSSREEAERAVLERALEVVERDVRAAGITGTLELSVPDRDADGQVWVRFRGVQHGNGIDPAAGRHEHWAIESVADATQEVIMEVLWRAWPVCPVHERGLHVEREDELVVWRCTGGGAHTVARVGEPGSPGEPRRPRSSARPGARLTSR